jgi:hypothetical protein
MTNVARTQAPEAPSSLGAEIDPIDLLVPPPPRRGRSLFRGVVAVLVLVAIAAVGSSGLVLPKLGLGLNAAYTPAGSITGPSLSFDVRNGGEFPLSITGVDPRARGLGGARVSVAVAGAGGAVRPSRGMPVSVGGGVAAHITMTFARWDCRAIEEHGSNTVPLHLSGPIGVDTTVSVVPGLRFDPPNWSGPVGTPDPREIGWSAGITWTDCHPGSEPPTTNGS